MKLQMKLGLWSELGGKTGQWDRTCLENSVGAGEVALLGERSSPLPSALGS